MVEAVITSLIYICLIVLAIYVVFWVLGEIGVSLPEQVKKIIWVIVALICLLVIARVLLPSVKLVSNDAAKWSVLGNAVAIKLDFKHL